MWGVGASGRIGLVFAFPPTVNNVPDPTPGTPPARRAFGALGWLLLAAVLVAVAWGGWRGWQALTPAPDQGPDLSPEALDARLLAAEQALVSLRRTHQGLDQRLTDTTARTGLLRDEVLGVGQRAAILEDSLRDLSLQASEGREALRLDEVELLLSLAQARLVKAAREYGRLAQLQFEGGVAPYMTVLQAQQALFPAELNEVQTRASLFSSIANVYKAMGGGWVTEAEALTR